MNINKIILFTGLLTIIGFASCQKNSLEKTDDTINLSNAAKQSINSESLVAVKQSYSLLDVEDKQVLWDTKWETILKNDADRLTLEQSKIILLIKNFVDKKTIKELMIDPTEGELFIKNNMSYFEKHFTKSQLYLLIECSYFCNNFSIFESINYLTKIDPRQSNGTNGKAIAGGNCECYYSISCSLGLGTCTDGNCTKIVDCGLTGTSNCTGKCT